MLWLKRVLVSFVVFLLLLSFSGLYLDYKINKILESAPLLAPVSSNGGLGETCECPIEEGTIIEPMDTKLINFKASIIVPCPSDLSLCAEPIMCKVLWNLVEPPEPPKGAIGLPLARWLAWLLLGKDYPSYVELYSCEVVGSTG